MAVFIAHASLVSVEVLGARAEYGEVEVEEDPHVRDLVHRGVVGNDMTLRRLNQIDRAPRGGAGDDTVEQLPSQNGAAGLIVTSSGVVDRVMQDDRALDGDWIT